MDFIFRKENKNLKTKKNLKSIFIFGKEISEKKKSIFKSIFGLLKDLVLKHLICTNHSGIYQGFIAQIWGNENWIWKVRAYYTRTFLGVFCEHFLRFNSFRTRFVLAHSCLCGIMSEHFARTQSLCAWFSEQKEILEKKNLFRKNFRKEINFPKEKENLFPKENCNLLRKDSWKRNLALTFPSEKSHVRAYIRLV